VKKTIEKVAAETLTLEGLFRSLKAGEPITYAEIQKRTNVRMDAKGRARLRTAAKRANRIYAVHRGIGLAMSDHINGIDIVHGRLTRVDAAVKKAEKTTTEILHQHSDQMTKDDRNHVMAVSVMFANVRVIADQHKRELRLAESRRPKCITARQA
jgi:hypothetical protein